MIRNTQILDDIYLENIQNCATELFQNHDYIKNGDILEVHYVM